MNPFLHFYHVEQHPLKLITFFIPQNIYENAVNNGKKHLTFSMDFRQVLRLGGSAQANPEEANHVNQLKETSYLIGMQLNQA